MIGKRKIVLVGTGFVGMSMAYALENQGGITELVLIDVLKDKAEGEAMDLAHGLSCGPYNIDIKAGDYDECKDANIVVITAGLSQKQGGQTRLELTTKNAEIVADVTRKVVDSGFKGIFVVASNPVDLMTYVVEKVSNFPKHKVIGSGTVLDTSRLRYLIGKQIGVSPKNVHAYILGEHGDSSFVPWSHAYVGCVPLKHLMEKKNIPASKMQDIYIDVQQAAYQIIDRKKATYYGIGMGLAKLVNTILGNANEILTVSTYVENKFNNEGGLFIGVPAVITDRGVAEIIDFELTKEEQEKFNNSVAILKDMQNMVDNVIKNV